MVVILVSSWGLRISFLQLRAVTIAAASDKIVLTSWHVHLPAICSFDWPTKVDKDDCVVLRLACPTSMLQHDHHACVDIKTLAPLHRWIYSWRIWGMKRKLQLPSALCCCARYVRELRSPIKSHVCTRFSHRPRRAGIRRLAQRNSTSACLKQH